MTAPKVTIQEAQAEIDGLLVAEICRDFGVNFQGVYPDFILARGVGPEQSFIGLAIKRGHLIRDDPEALVQSANVQALIAAAVEGAVQAELAALQDPLVVHLNMVAGKIAKPLPSQLVHLYGEDAIASALDRMLQEAEQRGREKALREAIRLCVPHVSTPSATAMTIGNLADAIQSLTQEPPR
jgi:hypothetical protein